MGPMVDVYKGPLVFCLLLVLGQNMGKTIKNQYHGYQAIDYAGAGLAVIGCGFVLSGACTAAGTRGQVPLDDAALAA